MTDEEQNAAHQIERKRQFPYTEYMKPGAVDGFLVAIGAEAWRYPKRKTA